MSTLRGALYLTVGTSTLGMPQAIVVCQLCLEPAHARWTTLRLCAKDKPAAVWLQPYMREAWRVEPLHTMHQGQPLDDLLAELHLQRSPGVSLDLSPASSRSSSGSSSPGSSSDGEGSLSEDAGWSGRGKAQGVTAADGVCGHILPVYPGPAAAFSPVCTHVETLLAGRAEGHAAMQRLMVPVARR